MKFPDDHPIAEALTEPIAGWTAVVKTKPVTTKIHTDAGDVSEAVDTVTWTAADNKGFGADEFQEFKVSVGLPADGDVLAFPTIQTYSNGDTVRWIQETPPGGEEPEDPRPELKLVAPASRGWHHRDDRSGGERRHRGGGKRREEERRRQRRPFRSSH